MSDTDTESEPTDDSTDTETETEAETETETETETEDEQAETQSFLDAAEEDTVDEEELKTEFDPADFGHKTWKFEWNGYLIEGSDPVDDDPKDSRGENEQQLTADDKVARLMAPTMSGDLLLWRAIQYLHDSPKIDRETWLETFSAKERTDLANRHLNAFGIQDMREDFDIEETAELIEAAEDVERAKMRGEDIETMVGGGGNAG